MSYDDWKTREPAGPRLCEFCEHELAEPWCNCLGAENERLAAQVLELERYAAVLEEQLGLKTVEGQRAAVGGPHGEALCIRARGEAAGRRGA